MREYLLVLLISAATTYVLAAVWRRVALRTGAVAKIRARDVHTVEMPYFGGVAMLCGVTAAFLVANHLPFLGEVPIVRSDSRAVLLGAAVICAVGVLDDLLDLNPFAKLAGQVLAAGLLVGFGVKMLYIPLNNNTIALDSSVQIAITVFFVLLCTNAVNYVDGLDGLAAGVVGIGAFAFFIYSYNLTVQLDLVRATTSSLITVAVVGACIGFLPHNFQPARMFMGDSGAMLLGFLLATSTISLTGQMDSSQLEDTRGGGGLLPTYLPLVLPLAILALPILDFVLAFVRRTYHGKWWFVADKQHLHHRLMQRGHGMRRAVLIMYAWTALVSFGVIALAQLHSWEVVVVIVVVAIVLSILTLGRPINGKGGKRKSGQSRLDDRPEVVNDATSRR
ncbi:undecaprenyl/decaprenyl-phosphate alpha-N-acetylglucosaminyl 1-phosphate transferase [Microlunatus elymi]|uniref:Undecaprenyl/decaprenyl-phosphate alpha-N-acetylglucosaminyl 1-phosphate transferase n=1 Tax=Microlunatus elymi TaxID=2596828 RepID=A0A516Q0V9_9ACTN|nr:MraY family glycosyltransferase [Microlunatus elymi]QDP97057.1 undecaprenyl/decaprenyl-phosphate alpha-N-acetylglucosaminyl 1-phosphate transferase [Microlunatus elymi]